MCFCQTGCPSGCVSAVSVPRGVGCGVLRVSRSIFRWSRRRCPRLLHGKEVERGWRTQQQRRCAALLLLLHLEDLHICLFKRQQQQQQHLLYPLAAATGVLSCETVEAESRAARGAAAPVVDLLLSAAPESSAFPSERAAAATAAAASPFIKSSRQDSQQQQQHLITQLQQRFLTQQQQQQHSTEVRLEGLGRRQQQDQEEQLPPDSVSCSREGRTWITPPAAAAAAAQQCAARENRVGPQSCCVGGADSSTRTQTMTRSGSQARTQSDIKRSHPSSSRITEALSSSSSSAQDRESRSCSVGRGVACAAPTGTAAADLEVEREESRLSGAARSERKNVFSKGAGGCFPTSSGAAVCIAAAAAAAKNSGEKEENCCRGKEREAAHATAASGARVVSNEGDEEEEETQQQRDLRGYAAAGGAAAGAGGGGAGKTAGGGRTGDGGGGGGGGGGGDGGGGAGGGGAAATGVGLSRGSGEEDDEEEEDEDEEDDEDGERWIPWFCALEGHDWFAEVEEEYIKDAFNLFGLKPLISRYEAALDMILGAAPDDEDLDEQHFLDVYRDAMDLYGLIHARYIITPRGLAQMREKYIAGEFGECPRVLCERHPVLPVGISPDLRSHRLRVYCPLCQGAYEVRDGSEEARDIDGAYFGPSFPHIFLQTFVNLVPLVVPVPYEPKIFGFRVHNRMSIVQLKLLKGEYGSDCIPADSRRCSAGEVEGGGDHAPAGEQQPQQQEKTISIVEAQEKKEEVCEADAASGKQTATGSRRNSISGAIKPSGNS